MGSAGRGLGEIFKAEGIEVDPTGRVYIDDKIYRNSNFQRRDNSHKYERVMNLSFVPSDQCKSGDALFIHGVLAGDPSDVIHSYLEDGLYSNTFGFLCNFTSSLTQLYLGKGHISCSHDPALIIFDHDYSQ